MHYIFVDLISVAIFMFANLPGQCVCGSAAQKFSRRQGQKVNKGYMQIKGTSAAGCTAACGSDETCEAVSYHAQDGVCLLSEHNPDDENGNDKYSSDSNWTMYKKHCGAPSSPTNGKVNVSSGTIQGRTATYSCNNGYLLEGNATVTCAESGNWSTAPTCAAKLGGTCAMSSECLVLFTNSECSSNLCACASGYVTTSANTSCKTGQCYGPWSMDSGSCYYSPKTVANWTDAEASCVEAGGHLESIRSGEENVISSRKAHWIGLHDTDKDGIFEWTSGEKGLPFTNWGEDEPSPTGNKSCVHVSKLGWFTTNCSMEFHFVCEKSPS